MAQSSSTESLGSGRRGWVFGKVTFENPRKVVIGYDPAPTPEMSELPYQYVEGYTKVLYRTTLEEGEIKSLPLNFWNGWISRMCFSFDKHALFDGTNLFRVKNGKISVLAGQAQAEARRCFGLSHDQIYLGCIEYRHFYYIKSEHHKVYYSAMSNGSRRVYCLKTPERALDLFGVARGDAAGDVVVWASAKPLRMTGSPSVPAWFILNLRSETVVE